METMRMLCLRKDVHATLRCRVLLAIIILAAGWLPHHSCMATETSNREYKAVSDLLKSNDGSHEDANKDAKPKTPMRVIGAGLGRTGTSSLVSALTTLGLKPYHFIEGIMNTPGHFDLWSEIVSNSDFPLSKNDADAILDKVSRDGFDATTDFPACMLYEEFFQEYPDALVVLTVRSSGQVWAESMMGTLGTIQETSSSIPWRWFSGFRKVARIQNWFMQAIGAPVDQETLLPQVEDLVRAHDHWTERVRSTIPSEKLLIHQYTDGWKPLCDFLVPILDEAAQQTCAKLVAKDEAYPSVNSKGELRNVVRFLRAMPWILKGSTLLILVVLVRRQRTKTQGHRKED